MDTMNEDQDINELAKDKVTDPLAKDMRSSDLRKEEETADAGRIETSEVQTPSSETEPDLGEPEWQEEEEEEEAKGKLKVFWHSKTLSRILIGLSLLFFALGIYFFIKPMIVHRNQDKIAQELLDRLKEQRPDSTQEVTVVVDTKDIDLPGSYRDEYDYILPPRVTRTFQTEETTETSKSPSIVTIRTDSIMRIPAINLEIAVAPDVNASSLWVLPGHYPSSPQPGEIGVAAYFGHRMYGKGRHFNRLDEVVPGDKIQVQRMGKLYNFVVESSDIIEPDDLGKYVFESAHTARILLVTCHPIQTTGVPKYRIVVRGYLESTETAG